MQLTSVVVAAGTLIAVPWVGAAQDMRPIDVGGHRIEVRQLGTGSPSVVLQSGIANLPPLWSHQVRCPASVSGMPSQTDGK